jgi:magnesium-transporting ATPase (P-type)
MNQVQNVQVSDTTGDAIKNYAGIKAIKTKTVQPIKSFWSLDKSELLNQTDASLNGLTESEASTRLTQQRGLNKIPKSWHKDLHLLLSQYKNPLVLLLVFAAILYLVLKEYCRRYYSCRCIHS